MEIYFEFSLAHSSNMFDIDMIVIAATIRRSEIVLIRMLLI
jgi:hypothetical protein